MKDLLIEENTRTEKAIPETVTRKIKADLRSRGGPTTAPEKFGDYFYHFEHNHFSGGVRLSRWKDDPNNPSPLVERLLDARRLAWERGGFADIGTMRLNGDHSKIAYTLDSTAAEEYKLWVFDIEKKEHIQVTDENVQLVEWADDDDCTLVYTVQDDMRRPHRVMRLRLGGDVGEVVLSEDDEAALCSVTKTKDNAFVILGTMSKNSSVSWLLRSETPWMDPIPFWGKQYGIQYHIEHNQGTFFVVKKDMSKMMKNFELLSVSADPVTGGPGDYTVLAPSHATSHIHDITVFRNHIVVVEAKDGMPLLRVIHISPVAALTESIEVDIPVGTCTLELGDNLDFASKTARVNLSSVILPPQSYDVDLHSGTLSRVGALSRPADVSKRSAVLATVAQDDELCVSYAGYSMVRIRAPTRDGLSVPVTMFFRGNPTTVGRRPRPLMLSVYGAYGSPLSLEYDPGVFPLLDRGWVVGYAHTRGGGDLGSEWYYAGRLTQKWNTFNDFVDATQCLIARGITSPRLVAAYGASAGGMAVGVALNTHPELFGAAVADVPFVDVLGSMADPNLPLTPLEYEEWGNPDDKAIRKYIASYDPILNVRHQAYPPVLATASFTDHRVPYRGVIRWIDRLRQHDSSGSPKLLRTSFDGNHFFHNSSDSQAIRISFLLDAIGKG